MIYLYYSFNFILLITNSVYILKYLHIYQLKSYNNARYLSFFYNFKSLFYLFCIVLFFFELFYKNILFYLIFNTIFYIFSIFFNKNLIKTSKTPLNYTKKLSRLYIFSIFIIAILCLYSKNFLLCLGLTPIVPIIANSINFIDKIKNLSFINKAKKKLKNCNTKIIAITGSNGKTSVKNILYSMLSTQYNTQASPASFNTPLGIAKFINNELKFSTEYLVLEYGARHKKDIKKLCSLYGADYGIITTISPQHLQTFKNLETIFLAKKELSDHLKNRLCVYNLDNLYTLRMFEEKTGEKLSVSIFAQSNVFADSIKIENNKTYFNLHINNSVHRLSTSLLGRHNIYNICQASAMASYLGISSSYIINSIQKLTPSPHRLNLIKTNINIFDDSYNCSSSSAKEALWVLNQFENKKMVVTPGIIEGGKSQFDINFNLGADLQFCDYCVIVGEENKQAISSGINIGQQEKISILSDVKKEAENQPFSNYTKIFFAKTLEEAKEYFKLLQTGDNLLLLNDLPDDYT